MQTFYSSENCGCMFSEFNSISSEIHIHLEPQKVTLFGNWILVDIIKNFRWNHPGLRMGPKFNDWCPHNKSRHRRTPYEEGDRCWNATAVTKEYWGLPIGTGMILLWPFRGSMILSTPWFQTSSLKNYERKKSVLFLYNFLFYFWIIIY
jgi:hypothetical protein